MLGTIRGWVYNCILNFRWHIEALNSRRTIKHYPVPALNKKEKILVLAPHSDDEWVGCSTIIRFGTNVTVVNLDMQGGDTPEIHRVRYEEMKAMAAKYGYSLVTIYQNKINELSNLIREFSPEYIFVPFFIDWHTDHQLVNEILAESLKECQEYEGLIVSYQVSVPIIDYMITNANGMNRRERKRKWLDFRSIYKTQSIFPTTRFSLNEFVNGKYSCTDSAEVYCVLSISKWLKAFEDSRCFLPILENLRNNLSSISLMRKIVEKIKVGSFENERKD